MASKGILIGLGNPIMSDDNVGIVVCEKLHRRLPDFEWDISCAGGFDVVDRILGYERVVIIDSMVTGKHAPGTVVMVEPESSVSTLRVGHTHGISFLDAIELARSCNAPVPAEVILYGIEVEDPFSPGQEMSQSVSDKVGRIVEQIVSDLSEDR